MIIDSATYYRELTKIDYIRNTEPEFKTGGDIDSQYQRFIGLAWIFNSLAEKWNGKIFENHSYNMRAERIRDAYRHLESIARQAASDFIKDPLKNQKA